MYALGNCSRCSCTAAHSPWYTTTWSEVLGTCQRARQWPGEQPGPEGSESVAHEEVHQKQYLGALATSHIPGESSTLRITCSHFTCLESFLHFKTAITIEEAPFLPCPNRLLICIFLLISFSGD